MLSEDQLSLDGAKVVSEYDALISWVWKKLEILGYSESSFVNTDEEKVDQKSCRFLQKLLYKCINK